MDENDFDFHEDLFTNGPADSPLLKAAYERLLWILDMAEAFELEDYENIPIQDSMLTEISAQFLDETVYEREATAILRAQLDATEEGVETARERLRTFYFDELPSITGTDVPDGEVLLPPELEEHLLNDRDDGD